VVIAPVSNRALAIACVQANSGAILRTPCAVAISESTLRRSSFTVFGDGSAEADAVVGGDRDVRGEPFFRVQCLHAIGDAMVGEPARRFEIVECPTFGPVVSTGDLMRGVRPCIPPILLNLPDNVAVIVHVHPVQARGVSTIDGVPPQ